MFGACPPSRRGKNLRQASDAKTPFPALPHHSRFDSRTRLGSGPLRGSSTTGIAANLANQRYLGIEKEAKFAQIGANRRQAMEQESIRVEWTGKIKDLALAFADSSASPGQTGGGQIPPKPAHRD